MHFKHTTIYHSKYINVYFHTQILKPLSLSQFQRLERAKSAIPTEGYLQNSEVKHTMDYEKKEVLKLKIQAEICSGFYKSMKASLCDCQNLEKYVSRFCHQSGSRSHLHSTHKCYTAVFMMNLLLADLI